MKICTVCGSQSREMAQFCSTCGSRLVPATQAPAAPAPRAAAQPITSLRTEVLAGITTFVTMAYIIVVNPAILSFAGIPNGPSTVATILTAVFGCLLMGVYARRPIAVAPYMG